MLWQLHHQFKDGHTEFKSQRESDPNDKHWSNRWVEETVNTYLLPEGAQWLMVSEESERFIRQIQMEV